ncbi:MAG: photosystem II reaction center protein PsbN [Synechococcales bacterium]|jgi:PsbN protein|nr:photosystem II reaction center protein PsbN [Cyanobacteria bacterium REEB444]MEB3126228.1 photosystem II reaction center protein PsbN [Synechococcales bacterium]NBO31661.1 photosystem II reaction center protein PsbN [Cyanobacteria bacterium WB6_1B_304]
MKHLLDPAMVLSISILLVVVAITAYTIYTAFGPPSDNLRDPFDEHED